MGFFTTTTIFDEDVDKATDECNTTEDWGLILKICDKVKNNEDKQEEFCDLILRKINQKVPRVSLQALLILDACVNNCGLEFNKIIASPDFITGIKQIIHKSHPKVTEKMKIYLRKWVDDFKDEAQLSRLASFYHYLRSEGMEFPDEEIKQPKKQVLTTNPDAVSSQQEEDDIAKAIELSLKDESKAQVSSLYATTTKNSSLYPSMQGSTTTASAPSAKSVKAIYDFEAAEDNELTFKAGDIITILDDSDANWWKGEGSNGSGLFPANFVTSDMSVEPEPEFGISKAATDEEAIEKESTVSFNDEVEVREVDQAEPPLEINEELMQSTLTTLQSTDPEQTATDAAELLRDEQTCIQMNPLIDAKLEAVDRRHLELTQLNEKILEALNMYDELMNESYAFPTVPAYSTLPTMPSMHPQMQNMQAYGMYTGNLQGPPLQQHQMQYVASTQQHSMQQAPVTVPSVDQSYQMGYSQSGGMLQQGQTNYMPQQFQSPSHQAASPMQPLM